MAAPIVEFAAIQESTDEELEIGRSVSPNPPLAPPPPPSSEIPATHAPEGSSKEGSFQVRGKWLQFDCPHCVRPMRLIAEDAGGLVDCAHCGLELIAPDPAIGRGARLSRASENRVGSLSRYNLRDLRGDQIEHEKTKTPEDAMPFSLAGETEVGEPAPPIDQAIDPNHSLARGSKTREPKRSKRAVKALRSEKVGKSFRRKEVLAERAIAGSQTEWDPLAADRPTFADSRRDRYGFWIALAVTAVVMTGIIVMAIRETGKSTEIFTPPKVDEVRAVQLEKKNRFGRSFAAAQQALASPSWETLAPLVRDPERVAPLMRSYYSEVGYEPIELVDFHAPVEVTVGGLTMHELAATEKSGNVRTLVLEQGEDGAKIDWELMVNLPRHTWNQFLDRRPEDPQEVSVIAARASVLDRYFADAGLDREAAIGFRFWQGSADSYYAVLPKGSELGERLAETLEWDKGRKLIIRACFDPVSKLNDRLTISGFVQTGWVVQQADGG